MINRHFRNILIGQWTAFFCPTFPTHFTGKIIRRTSQAKQKASIYHFKEQFMCTVAWKPLLLEPYVKLWFFFLKTQSKLLPQYKNLAVYLLLLSNTSQEILSDITSSFSDFIPPSWERKKKKKAYLSNSSEQTGSEV